MIKKLIIDTDMGIDDALTINFCAAAYEFDVLAITLVTGNYSMSVAIENSKRILSYLKIEHIPIYEGGSYNLMGKTIEMNDNFLDNTLANIELPPTTVLHQETMQSAAALVHYVNMYPGQVHLLCIGPLTNLALAFFLDNKFPSLVGSVTVVGADIDQITLDNATRFSEFNAWCDPLSYRIVNNCFKDVSTPIVLLDWRVIRLNILPFSMRESMRQECYKGKKHIEFFLKFSEEKTNSDKYHKKTGILCSDLVAAVLLKNPEYIEVQKRVYIHIIIEGGTKGHTTFTYDPEGVFQRVSKFNVDKVSQEIVKTLARD